MQIRQSCGVWGVFGHPRASHLPHLGLFSLQHQGLESTGITVSRLLARELEPVGGDAFESVLSELKPDVNFSGFCCACLDGQYAVGDRGKQFEMRRKPQTKNAVSIGGISGK